MYEFLDQWDDHRLALISKKVLNRPQECLFVLKRQLDERMIKDENDHRPRIWHPKASIFKLYFPAMQGVTQLDLTPLSPRSKSSLSSAEPVIEYKSMLSKKRGSLGYNALFT